MDIGKIKRINIFEDTVKHFNDDKIKESLKNSKINSRLIKEDIELTLEPTKNGKITILNSRTFEAAKNYENIAILNFASATNPGGGVKTGSNAQEECLCRCSTLYPCLNQKIFWDEYYNFHRNRKDTFYTNSIIYSPDILVFKKDIAEPIFMKEEDWYNVNVITSPAPNLRNEKNINYNNLLLIFKSRIRQILKVAIINNNYNIVLGAFGCGAFKNPPFIVSRAFKEVLIDEGYSKYFDNIIFAIITPSNNTENFDVFYRTFKSFL